MKTIAKEIAKNFPEATVTNDDNEVTIRWSNQEDYAVIWKEKDYWITYAIGKYDGERPFDSIDHIIRFIKAGGDHEKKLFWIS